MTGRRVGATAAEPRRRASGSTSATNELPTHAAETDPVFSHNRARVLAAGAPLLAAAQDAGGIHGDPGYSAPSLRAALDGLRQGRPAS